MFCVNSSYVFVCLCFDFVFVFKMYVYHFFKSQILPSSVFKISLIFLKYREMIFSLKKCNTMLYIINVFIISYYVCCILMIYLYVLLCFYIFICNIYDVLMHLAFGIYGRKKRKQINCFLNHYIITRIFRIYRITSSLAAPVAAV